MNALSLPARDADREQISARIGHYELQEFLGGSMARVYRARDTRIGRTVAIKILTEPTCRDQESKARFLNEARTAAGMAHDNVLSIHDFGEDDHGRPFMVMEFLRGENLYQAIREHHTGDLKLKLKIAAQIARALEYIHSRKIIHRDIKPDNVLITSTGIAKLMDFGVSKVEGIHLTRPGYVVGTPHYMAPEQVMGGEITPQADVYAFGILLYELICGVKPFSGDTVEHIFYRIVNDPVDPETLRAAGAPEPVCGLVSRCTAKEPADRPWGFAPVYAELDSMIAEMESPQPAPPKARPAPRPEWRLLLAIVLICVLVGAKLASLRSQARAIAAPHAPAAKVEPARSIASPSGDMVLVEAGQFLFGQSKDPVYLPAFYIDRTEVSNRAYALFCRETHRDLPRDFPADKPDDPVVNVSFAEANAFASWAGKRLPTGPEWEKAARGTDGRTYPWGMDRDESRANIGTGRMRPVNEMPEGASPYGALNMIGNAWEWVDRPAAPSGATISELAAMLTPAPAADEPWYTIRGLSFAQSWNDDAIWDGAAVPARFRSPDIGFRCAR